MSFSYENQGYTTFLVYTVGEGEVVDTMSLGMITNNSMPGITGTVVTQMNTKTFIKYNVTARVPADQIFSEVINKKRLLGFFAGVADAMISAEEYMLDPRTLILDTRYIFTDVSTGKATLICLPVIRNDSNVPDITEFIKKIMFTARFDQTENCEHVTKIINFINSSPSISLYEFKNLIDKLSGEKTVQQPAEKKVVPHISENAGAKGPEKRPAPTREEQKPKPVAKESSHDRSDGSAERSAFAAPFEYPGASAKSSSETSADDSGEEISFFYLMQHYNSENAARYKAQKAKKAEKKKGKSAGDEIDGKCTDKSAHKRSSADDRGFEIPGSASRIDEKTSHKPEPKPSSEQLHEKSAYDNKPGGADSRKAPVDFGETVILGDQPEDETVLLAEDMRNSSQIAYLLRVNNGEKVVIDKPIFKIGKERNYVDYYIGNNPAISRSHANIIVRNGRYYIVDVNSKNHTYVNDDLITSNTEVEIFNEDKIRLANEKFIFKLE